MNVLRLGRPGWGEFDPALGRVRTPTDDFYDHRKLVLDRIDAALDREAERTQTKRKKLS